MLEPLGLPKLAILFEQALDPQISSMHRTLIYKNLKEVLPSHFFDTKPQKERSIELLKKKLSTHLPLVKALPCQKVPSTMSFYSLFRYRLSAFKFFFDSVSQWLIPGKRLDVVLLYTVDFWFPDIGEEIYTLCEVIVRVEKQEELDQIQRNFPLIETEILLGVNSEYYSRKIFDIKGIAPNQKTSLIQHHIAALIKRMPKTFSSDVFTEMQHILILCHEDFIAQRQIRHLSQLICIHYLFRQKLLLHIKKAKAKRQIYIKFYKCEVGFPSARKRILAVMIGLNFLREKEVFEKRHLLQAIKHYIPNVELIDHTFFSNRRGSEQIITIYGEVKKNDDKDFTQEEITLLKLKLPHDLKNHISRLTLPVFMPRNEEEIMRNILSLSYQLKFLRDIPQVFISFDEQTERNLFFTVIFVRVLKEKENKSIQEIMRSTDTFLHYVHDRSRIVGYLRKKYPKQATVFQVKFLKENFLRGDHSIDLYKARQAVVSELSRILGEFRDFNGGMISKQNELLMAVREQLAVEKIKYNELLLENFFYSIAPIIMRTVLEPYAFKTIFKMLLMGLENGLSLEQKGIIYCKFEVDFSYALFIAHQRLLLDEVSKSLYKFYQSGGELVQAYVRTHENVSMGYIYRSPDVNKQTQFRQTLESLSSQMIVTII